MGDGGGWIEANEAVRGPVEDEWGLDESYWGLEEAVWGLDGSYWWLNQGAGKCPRQCCHPKGGNGAEGPKGPRTKGTATRGLP